MSFIKELREKSKKVLNPHITISKEDQEKLKLGKAIVAKDNQNSFLIKVNPEKLSAPLAKENLLIEKI